MTEMTMMVSLNQKTAYSGLYYETVTYNSVYKMNEQDFLEYEEVRDVSGAGLILVDHSVDQ